jgi:tellurite resistance protein TerC
VTQQDEDPGGGAASAVTSSLRFARKVAVAVIGTTVLAIGVALIVLPGPAFIVIPLGLAILATEFLWARRLLRRVREGATSIFQKRRDN